MSESARDMLYQQAKSVAETVKEFARQIESGEYGDRWEIEDDDGNTVTISASDESHALQVAYSANRFKGYTAEHVQDDEPAVGETPISEYPLEIVDERGREFAVVISTGGPHVEVVADGGYNARLEAYWGGEHVTLSGDYFNTFLDYFIER